MEINLCRVGEFFPAVAGRLTEGPGEYSALSGAIQIWKWRFNSMVWPTVHTDPSRKRSFSKALFKLEKFEKNERVSWPSLNQTQIQNDWWLLRFEIL